MLFNDIDKRFRVTDSGYVFDRNLLTIGVVVSLLFMLPAIAYGFIFGFNGVSCDAPHGCVNSFTYNKCPFRDKSVCLLNYFPSGYSYNVMPVELDFLVMFGVFLFGFTYLQNHLLYNRKSLKLEGGLF
jgi:hypothetical protein